MNSATVRPMPKHWRAVCDAAVAARPQLAGDEVFQRAVVAALRFALPRADEAPTSARELDDFASDPKSLAALAVDLLPVIRRHARGAR